VVVGGWAGRRNGIADSSPGHSRLETAIADERPGYRASKARPPQRQQRLTWPGRSASWDTRCRPRQGTVHHGEQSRCSRAALRPRALGGLWSTDGGRGRGWFPGHLRGSPDGYQSDRRLGRLAAAALTWARLLALGRAHGSPTGGFPARAVPGPVACPVLPEGPECRLR